MSQIVLYSREGCGLCAEARATLEALLEDRRRAGLPSPTLVERDITTNPDWERAYFTTIPVVELNDRWLELAISPAKLRRLLASLDEEGSAAPAAPGAPVTS
jgi:glutaredoxin